MLVCSLSRCIPLPNNNRTDPNGYSDRGYQEEDSGFGIKEIRDVWIDSLNDLNELLFDQ